MTTPEELAKEIHAHAVRQLRKKGGLSKGFMVAFTGTVPPTCSVTLRGSSEQVDGVRYVDTFNPSQYASFPEVIIGLSGDGDIWVFGALAS